MNHFVSLFNISIGDKLSLRVDGSIGFSVDVSFDFDT
jgi:hypothetical protein